MIYLIGVRHCIQCDGPNDAPESKRKIFSEYLRQRIFEYKITFLAEEFNEESVRGHRAENSTIKLLANDMKIKHRFCEPNSLEREKLGIPTPEELIRQLGVAPKYNIGSLQAYSSQDIEKIYQEDQKYFSIRKHFWLEKIEDCLSKNILFICGASHLDSFAQLLRNQNIPVTILETQFHL